MDSRGATHGGDTGAGEENGGRPVLAGVQVREEDIESQKGLDVAATVFRVAAVVIFLLALWQFAAWWADRPIGGAGLGLLVGDTIRLIVFAGLLWAAGDLASLAIKTHHDIRAARILLARQTSMIRQIGIAAGELRPPPPDGHRRSTDVAESGVGGD